MDVTTRDGKITNTWIVAAIFPGVLNDMSFTISLSSASVAVLAGIFLANLAAGLQARVGVLEFPNRDRLTVVLLVVIAPVVEELFVRGIVLTALLRKYSVVPAVLATAVLIAGVHDSFWPAFVGQVILTAVFLAFRRSLTASMITHVVGNLATIIPTTLLWHRLYMS